MDSVRKLHRRSFLLRVVGGGMASGALATVGGPARAQVTDHDPSDPVGRGRGGGTGITDADSGAGADPAGRGRGASGPPRGAGQHTGVTDADSGPSADPPQRGRGRQFGADLGQARERQAQECQAARGQLSMIDFEINRRDELLRELRTTANFIAGDLRETRERHGDQSYQSTRMLEYQRRANAYGIGTFYGQQPETLLNAFAQRIDQVEQEANNLRQQRAQVVALMSQYNCY